MARFEVGATWIKGRQQKLKIYPLCAPEVNPGQLPSPLDRLQALSMGKAADLKLLFQGLIEQFGFCRIGHDGTDGSTPQSRARNAGYPGVVGENAQFGANPASFYRDAQGLVDGWLSSPGHCRNLF